MIPGPVASWRVQRQWEQVLQRKAASWMRTLQATLKELTLRGERYTLVEEGYRWQAAQLLRWLERNFPTALVQPVEVVPPTGVSDGGIYLLDKAGEVIGSLPLYWIEPPPLSGFADEMFPQTASAAHASAGG